MIDIASPSLGRREREAVTEVAESGQLADACDATFGVATSNGTTALHTALRALGIRDGDRVVTTPFSFVATATAVRLCGAEPSSPTWTPGR